jgi:predicted enzyme related to lactoylglutathione lyase
VGEEWDAVTTDAWITSVVIDCADPERLARFWAGLLGLRVRPRESRYVALTRPPAGTPELVFQPVPEGRSGKVPIHLDVGVRDLAAARRRAEELGASYAADIDHAGDVSLLVMRDPEGNEFCLVHREPGEP